MAPETVMQEYQDTPVCKPLPDEAISHMNNTLVTRQDVHVTDVGLSIENSASPKRAGVNAVKTKETQKRRRITGDGSMPPPLCAPIAPLL